jgi:hypothetical protein
MLAAIDFQDPSTKWVLIAGAILVVTYLATRNKTKKKDPLEKQASGPAATPNLSLAQQRALERDMSQLVTELMEMARQMTAQMETRSAKLDLLLREADEKIAQFRALLDKTDRAAHGNGEPAAHIHPPAPRAELPPPSPPEQSSARHQQVYTLAEQGRTPHQIAQELGRQDSEVEMILALRPRQG